MQKTLAQIAQAIQGRVVGDGALLVNGVSGIKEARPGDLTFLANPKYAPLASDTQASAIIVGRDVLVAGKSVIQVDDPSRAFTLVVAMVKEDLTPKMVGAHPTAVIDPSVVLGEGVGIGPHAVIEKNAVIGAGTVICAGVFIGQKTQIGSKCLIYPNVTVREDCTLGNNVIIHSGTVIGSDGFGYNTVAGVHIKIPQTGCVVIEDDVEIGACVTIDRARFDKTVIGRGTKIDNLVQIAHNVRMGEHCLIIAQTGIAGSALLGNSVTIAGQVGIAGHVHVGDGAAAGAQTGITKDVPAGMKMFGTPAQEFKETIQQIGLVRRLPKYVERIAALEEKIKLLEEKSGK
ncbi:MAG: UDP-3-O-(3-hydroxymyristoyl)glucosamine N-acyltransferase [Candidatus Omnitrophica bacterium]|nr:UDP-3-O-(3-hydroxymyristoyl)glucosamine N-acyltransferase [Candidatus Omnitrophota bacterium]